MKSLRRGTGLRVWVWLSSGLSACSPNVEGEAPLTASDSTNTSSVTSTSAPAGSSSSGASHAGSSSTTSNATSTPTALASTTLAPETTTKDSSASVQTTESSVSTGVVASSEPNTQVSTTAPDSSSSKPGSGATTSTDTTEPPSAEGCGGADILCADFEDVAVGALPTGAGWVAAPGHCADTSYAIGVEAGSGSDGSQALASSNASSSTNACALVADLGEQSEFWVRAMVKYMGTGPTNEHEITFFELGEHADQDDPEGRVGFRTDGCNDTDGSPFGGLEFNMTKGPGGEFTGCTGVPLEGNRWYCVEIHVVASGAATSGELYLDGEEQSFTNHGMAVDEVLADGSFRYLKLGAQTYGSINTGPLLLDDVGVSTTRMACP